MAFEGDAHGFVWKALETRKAVDPEEGGGNGGGSVSVRPGCSALPLRGGGPIEGKLRKKKLRKTYIRETGITARKNIH